MRQASDVASELWGKNGELLTYLKDVKAMLKKTRRRKILKNNQTQPNYFQNIEMRIDPKQTKSIPKPCNGENFSFRNTIPRITAMMGLIEDMGVARDAPINSIEVKKVTAPNPQLRIPVRPKISPSRLDIGVNKFDITLYNIVFLSNITHERVISTVNIPNRIVANEKTSTPGISRRQSKVIIPKLQKIAATIDSINPFLISVLCDDESSEEELFFCETSPIPIIKIVVAIITTKETSSIPNTMSKTIVNKGQIEATGCDFDTSILCNAAKKNKSPKVTKRLEKRSVGKT